MRQKLSDETRKRMEAAGPCAASEFRDLTPGSAHEELFFQWFADNCDNEEARRKWDCYWWLSTKDLSSFSSDPSRRGDYRPFTHGGQSGNKTELLVKFESLYGPRGATPIAWPSEVSGWFTTRDQLEDDYQQRWQAWSTQQRDRNEDEDEDDEEDPVWQAWSKASDKRREWEVNNPVPMDAAVAFCRDDIQTFYAAFYNEFRNINPEAMLVEDLDPDYIDSLNEAHLKELPVDKEVKVIGYRACVLIGQFPPGYENSVMSSAGAWYGTLKITEKGGAFGAGKVSIDGCQGQDRDWFKKAFRRVSKKAIAFE